MAQTFNMYTNFLILVCLNCCIGFKNRALYWAES